MSTNLSKIIPLENIALHVKASDKNDLFSQIAELLKNQCSCEASAIITSLIEREQLASTGLGHAVAVPHGRLEGLKEPVAALIRLEEALPFDSPDNIPVQLLITLLIPHNVQQKHLEILSEVAEMFSDVSFRETLLSENSSEKVHALITSWLPKHLTK